MPFMWPLIVAAGPEMEAGGVGWYPRAYVHADVPILASLQTDPWSFHFVLATALYLCSIFLWSLQLS